VVVVRGFSPKLGFSADFLYLPLVLPRGNYLGIEWSSEAAMEGGGAQRPILLVNEPKKAGARFIWARYATKTQ
jgi:hypothetical protein